MHNQLGNQAKEEILIISLTHVQDVHLSMLQSDPHGPSL